MKLLNWELTVLIECVRAYQRKSIKRLEQFRRNRPEMDTLISEEKLKSVNLLLAKLENEQLKRNQ